MKQAIYFGMLILMALMINAQLSMCEGTREINTNCTMVTPLITNCTIYNYEVFNLSGQNVQSGNLTVLNDSIYYFNYTTGAGGHIVKLCDGTTREIVVKQEDDGNMIIGMLILLPMLLGGLLLWGVSLLNEEHWPLRWFVFFLSFALFFSSMNFGLLSLVEFYDVPALESLIGSTVNWVGWVLRAGLAYLFIFIIWTVLQWKNQKSKEDLEY